MQIPLVLLLVVAVAGVAWWLGRNRSRSGSGGRTAGEASARNADRPKNADPGSPAEIPALPAPGAASDALPMSLHELANEMSAFYDQSAHPQDLESNEHFRAGVARMADPATPLEQVVNFALGANSPLAAMAAAALITRDDSAPVMPRLISGLGSTRVWTIYHLFRYFAARADRPVAGPVLLEAAEWSGSDLVPVFASALIDARVASGERLALDETLKAHPDRSLKELEVLLGKLTTAHAATLKEQVERWKRTRVDKVFLRSIGRIWQDDAIRAPILESPSLSVLATAALDALSKSPPASLLVVGDAGAGKTTFVRLLARALMREGWTFFESSASEVLAGQVYMGELEQRVQRLIQELDIGRKVVWFLPNFHEFHYAGRHRYSPTGALDLIMPAVEAGRLCIVGEVEPGAFERVLQQRPRLRALFKSMPLEPASPADTMALVARWIGAQSESGAAIAPGLARDAMEMARHYLTNRALPGSVFDLLQQTAMRVVAAGGLSITRDHLLETLTELTGLPRQVVDDRAGLDPAALREHFAARVMGQPVAVQCLVDRVAMLKAGLTDPHRPIGVFLFAGPTGTGKTEVAKALAEFLFGSADRMIRLDMSEFQEPQSLARILGEAGEQSETNALVNRIRKQPFSVVLLDEFEKSHPRVWDLFLQVFDDGRLSDAQGNLADFRHSIIILTSNIGATEHRGSSLGFTLGDSAYSESQVTRAIGGMFRPEFVNRLDRMVVFRPLSRSVMRDILKKELRNVLHRRGFRSREWAVEWEESAIEFLLDQGFTPDMGARPLRRAIEEHVLAPIAMTIVENRFPEGDQFLFVKSDGRSVQVEFVDPDASASTADLPAIEGSGESRPTPFARMILSAAGTDEEKVHLGREVAALVERVEGGAWISEKNALLQRINARDFWEAEDRFRVLDRVEHMDRIEAGADTAQSLMRRLEHRGERRRPFPASVVSNLAQQLYLLNAALIDLDGGLSSDVYVSIEPVGSNERSVGRSAAWARTVMQMYDGWARKRGMRAGTLSEHSAFPAIIMVTGLGAYQILARERGLHVLEVPEDDGGFERCTARVRVASQPVEPQQPGGSGYAKALACLQVSGGESNAVVRRYREHPSPLVRDTSGGWRTGRLGQVLGGNFDLAG